MDSRVLRGEASGPAEWLLVFLRARDMPPRARSGSAVGPAEWLLVFLEGASAVLRSGRELPERDSVADRAASGDAVVGRLAAQGA